MNGYIALFNSKQIEVWAETSYEAQCKAARRFGTNKAYKVSVYLCEKENGEQVTTTITN
jgi:hypothetical protein